MLFSTATTVNAGALFFGNTGRPAAASTTASSSLPSLSLGVFRALLSLSFQSDDKCDRDRRRETNELTPLTPDVRQGRGGIYISGRNMELIRLYSILFLNQVLCFVMAGLVLFGEKIYALQKLKNLCQSVLGKHVFVDWAN